MTNHGPWVAALALAAAIAISGRAAASDLVAYSAFPEDLPELVAMLDAGADPNETSKPFGWSPIYAASINQNLDGAAALIDAGANVNFADPSSGMTPLHLAAGYGDADLAALLIAAGADVNAKDGQCLTPANHVGMGTTASRALIVNMLELAGGRLGRRC